ncbi:MAG: cytochrome c maturation protein CcmE [Candidatus Thalassarchaeaceae archaeon]|nr:cytochrome c maturation protein CcmE [Candidatus Thalassarchaeaceae archaeon]
MERRIRILVTLGLIVALLGLMLISVEPEVDLSVDQLMESPDQYEGETLRLHGTVQILDMENHTLILAGETFTIEIDYSGTSLPSGADEGKTISVRGELTSNGEDWITHAYEIKTGCPSKYEAEA